MSQKTDYVEEALSRLTTDNRRPNVQALVRVLATQAQAYEDEVYPMLDLWALPPVP